jgi:hypothetical protein
MYELKFDGYRALLLKDGQRVEIRSWKNKDLTGMYPGIAAAGLRAISTVYAVLDRHGLVTRRRRRRYRASGTALANAHALARVPSLARDQLTRHVDALADHIVRAYLFSPTAPCVYG